MDRKLRSRSTNLWQPRLRASNIISIRDAILNFTRDLKFGHLDKKRESNFFKNAMGNSALHFGTAFFSRSTGSIETKPPPIENWESSVSIDTGITSVAAVDHEI